MEEENKRGEGKKMTEDGKKERTQTCSGSMRRSLMNHFKFAAGFDLLDVQLMVTTSPTLFLDRVKYICGPSVGNTARRQEERIEEKEDESKKDGTKYHLYM